MSAENFIVIAVVVAGPGTKNDIAGEYKIVDPKIGFQFSSSNIRTLSSTNPDRWNKLQGLLYVPELPFNSPCINETKPYVPANVTRISDFDSQPIVAFAPWTSVECVQQYFAQIRDDQARAALWFLPGNSTTALDEPPVVDNPMWDLHDGGAWLQNNRFPIYALPGGVASYMMTELAAYSGNLTEEPNGDQLVARYDSRDSVRLWTTIPVDNETAGIPSLWVFLIIVLAILLFVVITTSFIMHLVQAHHRRALQRRVANGEVDLEALGIKRLNVPQEVLDKMPQYIYTSKAEPATDTAAPTAATTKSAAASTTPHRVVQFSQPICPICLDDFISTETTIRELPCKHIFHPECIDPFLKENSSLCPMCKKSSLPPGYCPIQITNLMVRRERLIRRMRQRVRVVHGEEIGGPQGNYGRRRRLYNNLTSRFRVETAEEAVHRRRYAATARTSSRPNVAATGDVEMVNVAFEHSEPQSQAPGTEVVPTTEPDVTPPPEVARQGTAARRAWRRQRLASVQASAYDREARAADEAAETRWKRICGKIFPTR